MTEALSTADRVRDFIIRAARLRSLRDDEDLLATGLVNSLLLVQILAFVENDIGIEVCDDDLITDNFRSVDAITALVGRTCASDPATDSRPGTVVGTRRTEGAAQ
jgi:acyl carrier protein